MTQQILVLEDDPSLRKPICDALREQGYNTVEVSSGREAVNVLGARPFDLVVTDFVHPEIDGLKLVELIHAKWPTTRVILMTGYLSRAAAEILLEGRAKFIEKPVVLDSLLALVKRLLPG